LAGRLGYDHAVGNTTVGTSDRCAVWARSVRSIEGWNEAEAEQALFGLLDAGARDRTPPPPNSPLMPEERHREVAELRAILADPGSPPILVIGGPSGVGKRRLLRHTLREQQTAGEWSTLHSCDSGLASLHRGLAAMLEGVLGEEGAPLPRLAEAVLGAVGEGFSDSLLGYLRPSAAAPIGSARFLERGDLRERRAYAAIDALLRNLAEHSNLLWVVEDLEASRWVVGPLIEFLARSAMLRPYSLRIVVTVTTPPEDAGLLDLLDRWTERAAPLACELPCARLKGAAALAFAHQVADLPSEQHAEAAQRLGDGIPQLMVQMARGLQDEPQLLPDLAEGSLDAWRRRLLGSRVDRLLARGERQAVMDVLAACALVPSELPMRLIEAAAVAWAAERVDVYADTVDLLIDAGLLRAERWMRDGSLQLSHPLYRPVLLALYPDDRSERLEAGLAKAVGGTGRSSVEALAAADLLAMAGSHEEALERAQLAEDVAVVGSWPSTVCRAVDLVERLAVRAPNPDVVRRSRVRRAAALVALGDPGRALESWKQVHEPEHPEVPVVALQRLAALALQAGRLERAESLIAAAETLLDEVAPKLARQLPLDLRVEVSSLRASAALMGGRPERAKELLQGLFQGEVPRFRRALLEDRLAWAKALLGEREDALALLEAALEQARRERRLSYCGGWLQRSRTLIGIGLLTEDAIETARAAAGQWATAHGDWALVGRLAQDRGSAAARAGRAEEARAAMDRSLFVAQLLDRQDSIVASRLAAAVAEARLGERPALAPELHRALDRLGEETLWRQRQTLVAAGLAALEGERAKALELAADLAEWSVWYDRDALHCVEAVHAAAVSEEAVEVADVAARWTRALTSAFGD
jgi:tetratricopeptide (TPR) repeat protein